MHGREYPVEIAEVVGNTIGGCLIVPASPSLLVLGQDDARRGINPSGNRRGKPATPEESPDDRQSPIRGVPLDTVYDILRNERRRLILHYLVSVPDHEAAIGSLATQIAAWENGIPHSAVTSTLRKRTYNTLQQTHLPRMDEAGLVDYDHHRGTVVLAVKPRQVEIFLGVLPRTGSVWTTGFLLSGFVLWLLLALNWLLVHVFQVYKPGSGSILTGLTLALVFVGFLHVYRILR